MATTELTWEDSNWLWNNNRIEFAYYLQSISSRIFSGDRNETHA